jgi:hypothetical protein
MMPMMFGLGLVWGKLRDKESATTHPSRSVAPTWKRCGAWGSTRTHGEPLGPCGGGDGSED